MKTWRCVRLGLDHRRGEAGIVGRHVAPAEQLQPFGLDHARDHGFAIDALRVVARHEHVADGVMAGLGQLDPERRANLFQEVMRDLHQDAGAVAGKRVGPGRAAMGEVLQNLQAMLDDLVARPRLSDRRRNRRRKRRARASDHRVLAPAGAQATPQSANQRNTHGMSSSHATSATPRAPSESGARKALANGRTFTSRERPAAERKNRLLRRLAPSLSECGAKTEVRLPQETEAWSLAPQPP